jgi:hypothetical protein
MTKMLERRSNGCVDLFIDQIIERVCCIRSVVEFYVDKLGLDLMTAVLAIVENLKRAEKSYEDL